MITRRRFIARLAATSAVWATWPDRSGVCGRVSSSHALPVEGGVSSTANAFVVNGRPRFLAAGSMDYFRCPASLWQDRILKAKRAGLNTIMTYVAWNQHEPEEGKYNFEGRSDIAAFLRICAELEMLAIVRVGPFICDEFEMGGHPAWLLNKPGAGLRIRSSVADPYIERWLAQLCAQIAPLQVSRGGPVILMQAENEYYYAERPGAGDYLAFLYQTLRHNGIEVPLTSCGNGSEAHAPGYFDTVNGYNPGALAQFRKRHPDSPLLISEHYTDWFDVWTWPQTDFPKRPMLEQESIEALSQGVMLSYFCFHGGTNFGFNGSSSWKTDHTWVTNRYFGEGPIAEGGALNPNYFAAKSASLPIAQFEAFFVSASPFSSLPPLKGPVIGRGLRSSQGTLLFILPSYPRRADQRFSATDAAKPVTVLEDQPTPEMEAATGVIQLPTGNWVALAAGSVRSLVLPLAFHLDDRNVIDYANATLLGMGGNPDRRVVLFWGESGREGHVSINGAPTTFQFPDKEPKQIAVGGVTVIALSSQMADSSWFPDGRVVIGPAFVAGRVGVHHQCFLDETTAFLLAVEKDGSIQSRRIPPESFQRGPTTSVLPSAWTRISFTEPQPDSSGWRPLDGPRCVEELDAYYGYTWYRARASSASDRETALLFTSAADRVHVWVNGKHSGIYGRGAGAERDLLPLRLPAGDALITMLVDNMGRSSEGSTQQRKGIWGPVYAGAGRHALPQPSFPLPAIPTETTWRFQKYKADLGPTYICHTAQWQISSFQEAGLFLALRELPHYAWIYLDGALVGEHSGDDALLDGFAASEYLLPLGRKTAAVLKIIFFGETLPDLARSVHLYTYPLDQALHGWEFRSWTTPALNSSQSDHVDPGVPCWWQTEFASPLQPPLFFSTLGLSKGQIYLNGEPTGRYWEAGPHHRIYLPEDALRSRNTIGLIDEAGASPQSTFLMRDANAPVVTVIF